MEFRSSNSECSNDSFTLSNSPGKATFEGLEEEEMVTSLKSENHELKELLFQLRTELQDERNNERSLRREQHVEMQQLREEERKRTQASLTEARRKLYKEKQQELGEVRERLLSEKDKEVTYILKQKDEELKKAQQTWLKEQEELVQKVRVQCSKEVRLDMEKGFEKQFRKFESQIEELREQKKQVEESCKLAQEADKRKAQEMRRIHSEHEQEMTKLKRSSWQEGRKQMAEIRQLTNIIYQLEKKLGVESGHYIQLQMEKDSLRDKLDRVKGGDVSGRRSPLLSKTDLTSDLSVFAFPTMDDSNPLWLQMKQQKSTISQLKRNLQDKDRRIDLLKQKVFKNKPQFGDGTGLMHRSMDDMLAYETRDDCSSPPYSTGSSEASSLENSLRSEPDNHEAEIIRRLQKEFLTLEKAYSLLQTESENTLDAKRSQMEKEQLQTDLIEAHRTIDELNKELSELQDRYELLEFQQAETSQMKEDCEMNPGINVPDLCVHYEFTDEELDCSAEEVKAKLEELENEKRSMLERDEQLTVIQARRLLDKISKDQPQKTHVSQERVLVNDSEDGLLQLSFSRNVPTATCDVSTQCQLIDIPLNEIDDQYTEEIILKHDEKTFKEIPPNVDSEAVQSGIPENQTSPINHEAVEFVRAASDNNHAPKVNDSSDSETGGNLGEYSEQVTFGSEIFPLSMESDVFESDVSQKFLGGGELKALDVLGPPLRKSSTIAQQFRGGAPEFSTQGGDPSDFSTLEDSLETARETGVQCSIMDLMEHGDEELIQLVDENSEKCSFFRKVVESREFATQSRVEMQADFSSRSRVESCDFSNQTDFESRDFPSRSRVESRDFATQSRVESRDFPTQADIESREFPTQSRVDSRDCATQSDDVNDNECTTTFTTDHGIPDNNFKVEKFLENFVESDVTRVESAVQCNLVKVVTNFGARDDDEECEILEIRQEFFGVGPSRFRRVCESRDSETQTVDFVEAQLDEVLSSEAGELTIEEKHDGEASEKSMIRETWKDFVNEEEFGEGGVRVDCVVYEKEQVLIVICESCPTRYKGVLIHDWQDELSDSVVQFGDSSILDHSAPRMSLKNPSNKDASGQTTTGVRGDVSDVVNSTDDVTLVNSAVQCPEDYINRGNVEENLTCWNCGHRGITSVEFGVQCPQDDDVSDEVNDDVTNDVNDDVINDVDDDVGNEVDDDVSDNGVSNDISNDVTDHVNYDISNDVNDDVKFLNKAVDDIRERCGSFTKDTPCLLCGRCDVITIDTAAQFHEHVPGHRDVSSTDRGVQCEFMDLLSSSLSDPLEFSGVSELSSVFQDADGGSAVLIKEVMELAKECSQNDALIDKHFLDVVKSQEYYEGYESGDEEGHRGIVTYTDAEVDCHILTTPLLCDQETQCLLIEEPTALLTTEIGVQCISDEDFPDFHSDAEIQCSILNLVETCDQDSQCIMGETEIDQSAESMEFGVQCISSEDFPDFYSNAEVQCSILKFVETYDQQTECIPSEQYLETKQQTDIAVQCFVDEKEAYPEISTCATAVQCSILNFVKTCDQQTECVPEDQYLEPKQHADIAIQCFADEKEELEEISTHATAVQCSILNFVETCDKESQSSAEKGRGCDGFDVSTQCISENLVVTVDSAVNCDILDGIIETSNRAVQCEVQRLSISTQSDSVDDEEDQNLNQEDMSEATMFELTSLKVENEKLYQQVVQLQIQAKHEGQKGETRELRPSVATVSFGQPSTYSATVTPTRGERTTEGLLVPVGEPVITVAEAPVLGLPVDLDDVFQDMAALPTPKIFPMLAQPELSNADEEATQDDVNSSDVTEYLPKTQRARAEETTITRTRNNLSMDALDETLKRLGDNEEHDRTLGEGMGTSLEPVLLDQPVSSEKAYDDPTSLENRNLSLNEGDVGAYPEDSSLPPPIPNYPPPESPPPTSPHSIPDDLLLTPDGLPPALPSISPPSVLDIELDEDIEALLAEEGPGGIHPTGVRCTLGLEVQEILGRDLSTVVLDQVDGILYPSGVRSTLNYEVKEILGGDLSPVVMAEDHGILDPTGVRATLDYEVTKLPEDESTPESSEADTVISMDSLSVVHKPGGGSAIDGTVAIDHRYDEVRTDMTSYGRDDVRTDMTSYGRDDVILPIVDESSVEAVTPEDYSEYQSTSVVMATSSRVHDKHVVFDHVDSTSGSMTSDSSGRNRKPVPPPVKPKPKHRSQSLNLPLPAVSRVSGRNPQSGHHPPNSMAAQRDMVEGYFPPPGLVTKRATEFNTGQFDLLKERIVFLERQLKNKENLLQTMRAEATEIETNAYIQKKEEDLKIMNDSVRFLKQENQKKDKELIIKIGELNKCSFELEQCKSDRSDAETQREKMEDTIASLQNQLNQLQSVNMQFHELKCRHSSLENENADFREQVNRLHRADEDFVELERTISNLQTKLKELEEVKRERDEFNEQLRSIRNQKDHLVQKGRKVETERNDFLMNNKLMEQQKENLEARNKALQRTNDTFKAKISSLEKEFRDCQRNFFEAQRERDTSSSQLRKIETERDEMKKRVNELLECKSELKQSQSKCRDFERDLSYLTGQCKKLESQRAELSSELGNCLKERNKLEGRAAELEQLSRGNEKLEEKFHKLKLKIAELTSQRDDAEVQLPTLKAKVALLKKACKEKDEQVEKHKEEVQELKHSIATSALDDLSKIRSFGFGSPENFVKFGKDGNNNNNVSKASSGKSDKGEKYVVLFDYDPSRLSTTGHPENELKLSEGDVITVFGDLDLNGYYMAEFEGNRGLVPSLYIEEMNDYDIRNLAKRLSPPKKTSSPPKKPQSVPVSPPKTPATLSGLIKRPFVAVQDYNPHSPSNTSSRPELEIPLTAGEVVTVVGDVDNNGYYTVEKRGKLAFIPSNLVKPASPSTLQLDRTGLLPPGVSGYTSTLSEPLPNHWPPSGNPSTSQLIHSTGPASTGGPGLSSMNGASVLRSTLVPTQTAAEFTSLAPTTSYGLRESIERHSQLERLPSTQGTNSRMQSGGKSLDLPSAPKNLRVLRCVNKDALLVSWLTPDIDELARNNGQVIKGFKICANDEPKMEVDSPYMAKALVENLDLSRPIELSIQTVAENGFCSEKTLSHFNEAVMLDTMSVTTEDIGSLDNSLPYKTAVALYSYDPYKNSPNPNPNIELAFQEGDIVRVLDASRPDGFYMAQIGEKEGLVPSNFIEEIAVASRARPRKTNKLGKGKDRSNKFPPRMKAMVAIADYDPAKQSSNVLPDRELGFRKGQIIRVHEPMRHDGFYEADVDGVRGLVPSNYIKPCKRKSSKSPQSTNGYSSVPRRVQFVNDEDDQHVPNDFV